MQPPSNRHPDRSPADAMRRLKEEKAARDASQTYLEKANEAQGRATKVGLAKPEVLK